MVIVSGYAGAMSRCRFFFFGWQKSSVISWETPNIPNFTFKPTAVPFLPPFLFLGSVATSDAADLVSLINVSLCEKSGFDLAYVARCFIYYMNATIGRCVGFVCMFLQSTTDS